MSEEDQIKALAGLDGWIDLEVCGGKVCGHLAINGKMTCNTIPVPRYPSSYNAIIPLIQKQPHNIQDAIVMWFYNEHFVAEGEDKCTAKDL